MEPKEEELEANGSPGCDLEGSLARSVVHPDHVEGDEIKTDSGTILG